MVISLPELLVTLLYLQLTCLLGRLNSLVLFTEAVCFSEMSAVTLCQTTQCDIPQSNTLLFILKLNLVENQWCSCRAHRKRRGTCRVTPLSVCAHSRREGLRHLEIRLSSTVAFTWVSRPCLLNGCDRCNCRYLESWTPLVLLSWNHPETTAERIFLYPIYEKTYLWFHGGDYEEYCSLGCDVS
jgi:hypothetical protein